VLHRVNDGAAGLVRRTLGRAPTTGRDKGGSPGAIAVVQTAAHVRVLTAGVGDPGTNRAIGTGDTVRIASISKAFNGAIALALVSQGKLLPHRHHRGGDAPIAGSMGAGFAGPAAPPYERVPDYIKSPEFLRELRTDPQVELNPTQLLLRHHRTAGVPARVALRVLGL